MEPLAYDSLPERCNEHRRPRLWIINLLANPLLPRPEADSYLPPVIIFESIPITRFSVRVSFASFNVRLHRALI